MAEPPQLAFRAMGSRCRVVVDAGSANLPAQVRDLVLDLERTWSRFLPDSEVSALNDRAGHITLVSNNTFRLISLAETARQATGGRFNPLMLTQLEAHGYRHSWESGPGVPDARPVTPGSAEPIWLDSETSAVRLPDGSRFDPGGIGKGLAVDLAIELCRQLGATTASVELGGDLRVTGEPWYGPRWEIGVADPFDREQRVGSFTPTEGAVTTSTTLIKSWMQGQVRYHHLLDPVSGCPSSTDLVAVTTCSSAAWWSEVAAKTALLSGSAEALRILAELNTPGIAVTADGEVLSSGSTDQLASVAAGIGVTHE